MTLIDSNLIIYAVQAEYKNLRQWIVDTDPKYSIISRVEVLGFARIKPIEKQVVTDLLNNMEIIYLNLACYELAIILKQQRRMSLGDALIAATCIEYNKTLATRNIADFEWIEGLKVINPLL